MSRWLRHAREAHQILGAPVVPPPALTRALVRARTGLASLSRRSAPPPVQVLEALFGLFDNRVLGVLVALDIPEQLDRRRTLADLAEATGAAPDRLERLLRYAAAKGFVAMDRQGRYRATSTTVVLRRDHPSSWRPWVEFATSDWFWDAWRHADRSVLGASAMEAATGHPFFTFVNEVRPDAGVTFNEAMAAGSAAQALALDGALGWSNIRTVCDVGGGTGTVLARLLDRHAHLEATLVDLPEVVAAAVPALAGPLAGRVRLHGGSFFDPLPAGCDRYLLLAIVHDWDDADAARILRRVADALGPTGRAVVVEGVLPAAPRDEFVVASDLLMMVLASGRERTMPQFAALFARSGLAIDRLVPLATGFTAFELCRSS